MPNRRTFLKTAASTIAFQQAAIPQTVSPATPTQRVFRTGDCAQALSGLNLVPLAPGRATIKSTEIVEAVDRAGSPPYPVPVGAISIESPVRRTRGQAFDFEEMKKISTFAREKKIGMHLDG